MGSENKSIATLDKGQLTQRAIESMANNHIVLDMDGLASEAPFVRDMSAMQIVAAVFLYRTGDIDVTSGLLGLNLGEGSTICRCKEVRRLVKFFVRSDLETRGLILAKDTLYGIMDDKAESANARIRAAEAALKWAGEMDRQSEKDDEDELSSMSIAELESKIAGLEQVKDKKVKALPDVTPTS